MNRFFIAFDVCLLLRTDSVDGGHVVSNGTFSKIFAPGIRLGWIEGPRHVLNRLQQRYVHLLCYTVD